MRSNDLIYVPYIVKKTFLEHTMANTHEIISHKNSYISMGSALSVDQRKQVGE